MNLVYIRNWIFGAVLVVGFALTGAPANAVTISAGETVRFDFNLSNFTPAYDASAPASFDLSALTLLAPLDYTAKLFNDLGLRLAISTICSDIAACPIVGGGFNNTILGANPYLLVSVINGSINITDSAILSQGDNRAIGFVAPVPLPATLPLLGAGLAGLGAMGWVKRRREQRAAQ